MIVPCAIVALLVAERPDLLPELELPELAPLLAPAVAVAVVPPAGAVATGAAPLEALSVVETSERKGLSEFPPRAFVRSKVNSSMSLCCCRLTDRELLLIGEPSFTAQIHWLFVEEKSIVPPFQEAQLEPVGEKNPNGQPNVCPRIWEKPKSIRSNDSKTYISH